MRACLWFCAAVFGLVSPTLLADVVRYQLRNEQEASSPELRERMKYLVSCALPAEAVVEVTVNGESFSFEGSIGLAPGWLTRGLTTDEQRWVTSCMLARTNYYGKRVNLSIRADSPGPVPAALTVSAEEARLNPLFEAAFFGNIFIDDPEMYVCAGDAIAQRAAALERKLRVCSLPDTETSAAPDTSRCGFHIVGTCSTDVYQQNGTDYSKQVLKVYLPAAD